jgi:hypothetical protein
MEETFEDFASDQEFDGFDDDAIANVLDLMNDGNSSKTAINSTVKPIIFTPSPPSPRSPAALPPAPRNLATSKEDTTLDDLMASIDNVLRKVRTEESDDEIEEHSESLSSSPSKNEQVHRPMPIENDEVISPKPKTLPSSSPNTCFHLESNVTKAGNTENTLKPKAPEKSSPRKNLVSESSYSISLQPHLVSLASQLYEKIMETTYMEASTFDEMISTIVQQSNMIPFILSSEILNEMLKSFEKESPNFQIFLQFIHSFGTIFCQNKNIQTFISSPDERIEFFLVVLSHSSSKLDIFSIDLKQKWEIILQNVIQFGKMELQEKKWKETMLRMIPHQSSTSNDDNHTPKNTVEPKRRASFSSSFSTVDTKHSTTSSSLSNETGPSHASSEEAFRLAKEAARLQNFKIPIRKNTCTVNHTRKTKSSFCFQRHSHLHRSCRRSSCSFLEWKKSQEEKKFTFKPKVNQNNTPNLFVYHTKEEAQMTPKERFVSRMQRDISTRREKNIKKIAQFSSIFSKKAQTCFVSKNSIKILQQNGKLEETHQERIHRLFQSKQILLQEIQQKAKHQEKIDLKTGRKFFVPLINKKKKKTTKTTKKEKAQEEEEEKAQEEEEEEEEEKEKDHTWVYESLYLRGIERKLRHEQRILQKEQVSV